MRGACQSSGSAGRIVLRELLAYMGVGDHVELGLCARTWLEVSAGAPRCLDGIMSFALIVGFLTAVRGENERTEAGGTGLGLQSGC